MTVKAQLKQKVKALREQGALWNYSIDLRSAQEDELKEAIAISTINIQKHKELSAMLLCQHWGEDRYYTGIQSERDKQEETKKQLPVSPDSREWLNKLYCHHVSLKKGIGCHFIGIYNVFDKWSRIEDRQGNIVDEWNEEFCTGKRLLETFVERGYETTSLCHDPWYYNND